MKNSLKFLTCFFASSPLFASSQTTTVDLEKIKEISNRVEDRKNNKKKKKKRKKKGAYHQMLRDAFKSKLTDKEKYELEQERINKSLGGGTV